MSPDVINDNKCSKLVPVALVCNARFSSTCPLSDKRTSRSSGLPQRNAPMPTPLFVRSRMGLHPWRFAEHKCFERGREPFLIPFWRKLLGKGPGGQNYIETIPRHGYRFIGPVEAIGNGKGGISPAPPKESSSGIHSLAVLPLVNFSGNPDQEYFAEGMTEALISGLAQALPLKAISRTSVMRYKGGTTSLPTIGKELNVDAVLEGSVFRSGERVRITVQLIHAPEDRHIWARSYERDFQDVLALQNDLADAIAGEIRIMLEHRENPQGFNPRLRNPAAYEEYLKVRFNEVRIDCQGSSVAQARSNQTLRILRLHIECRPTG